MKNNKNNKNKINNKNNKNKSNKKENIINIIKKYKNKNLLNDLNLLNNFIEEINKNKICERNKFGEVMTPPWLINEILDKLDEIHKKRYNRSIFEENYTWFDPCSGMGNFHIEIFKRLRKYKHTKEKIIKEMLYANEINEKNVFLYKIIFGKECNINCSNSLELKDKKYNIIIGNPPYNSGTKNSGNTIYQKFIEKFINNYDKYFSFITPPGWRKPMDEKCLKYNLYNLMTKDNHLNYLSIHDIKDGLKTFNAGTRYDWYIIDKNIKNKESIIYGIDKKEYKIKCNEWLFIPNGKLDLINNIFDFKKKNNLNIVCSRSDYDPRQKYVSNIKTKEFKYELLHSTPKNGPIYKYTSNNAKCGFNIPKIIFGESGINKIIIDKEGKYGLTNGCIGINIKDYNDIELNKLIKVLESDKFKNFLKYFSFSIFRIEWRIFTYFKKDFFIYF